MNGELMYVNCICYSIKPSLIAQSFALAHVDELSPRGGLYNDFPNPAQGSFKQQNPGHFGGSQFQPSGNFPPSHHITKRGGTMGYGGVYTRGQDGRYDTGSHHDTGVQHGGGEGAANHDYYDQYYDDDYGDYSESRNNLQNNNQYFQGYDYNTNYYSPSASGRDRNYDYTDFQTYDPYKYYSGGENSYIGYGYRNDAYNGGNDYYYRK